MCIARRRDNNGTEGEQNEEEKEDEGGWRKKKRKPKAQEKGKEEREAKKAEGVFWQDMNIRSRPSSLIAYVVSFGLPPPPYQFSMNTFLYFNFYVVREG